MLMVTARGCYCISREQDSGWPTVTLPGALAGGGELRLRQDEEHVWWAYSESIDAYIPFAPTEQLTDDLLGLECEFRANELIGWEHRPHKFPALARPGARRASQARVAELERQQRSRRGSREQAA